MEDNRRLILDIHVSDQDAVQAIPNDPQTINASTPADVAITSTEFNPNLEIKVASGIDEIPANGEILFLPLTINNVDQPVISFSHDTRLASNRSYTTQVDGRDDRQF